MGLRANVGNTIWGTRNMKKVKGDENTTGLTIKPPKSHLYAQDETIANQFREILSNKFSEVTVHSNMDINRLNTPVGSDEWVWIQLEEVLVELESTIKKNRRNAIQDGGIYPIKKLYDSV